MYPQSNKKEVTKATCIHVSKLGKLNCYLGMVSWKGKIQSQVPLAHACNPSYLGGWDWKIVVWGQFRQKVCETPPPHLQNTQSKMDWRCGSSICFASARPWVQTPIPPYPPKKDKIQDMQRIGKVYVKFEKCKTIRFTKLLMDLYFYSKNIKTCMRMIDPSPVWRFPLEKGEEMKEHREYRLNH
jgi:hypothetical protein